MQGRPPLYICCLSSVVRPQVVAAAEPAGRKEPVEGSNDRTLSRSCPVQKRKNFVSRVRTTPLRSVVLSAQEKAKHNQTVPCRPHRQDPAPRCLGPPLVRQSRTWYAVRPVVGDPPLADPLRRAPLSVPLCVARGRRAPFSVDLAADVGDGAEAFADVCRGGARSAGVALEYPFGGRWLCGAGDRYLTRLATHRISAIALLTDTLIVASVSVLPPHRTPGGLASGSRSGTLDWYDAVSSNRGRRCPC